MNVNTNFIITMSREHQIKLIALHAMCFGLFFTVHSKRISIELKIESEKTPTI